MDGFRVTTEDISMAGYAEFKRCMDDEISKAAAGFVRIGYLLKVARDSDVLTESGYKSVAEFAQAEYGLTKDVVSRYIAINDKYSEGGYSDQLSDKYRSYGYAKLTEMLTLPEMVAEQITPDYTRSEIQAIKEEIKEEQAIPELLVRMEQKEAEEGTLLEMVWKQYGKENPKEFVRLYDTIRETKDTTKYMDIMAPTGIASIFVRIAGIGRIMISITGTEKDVTLLNVRENTKEVLTQIEFFRPMLDIVYCQSGTSTGIEVREGIYAAAYPEEKEPEKPQVAPVQPKKPEPKKESKVTKAKKIIKKLHEIKKETVPAPEEIPEPVAVEEPVEERVTQTGPDDIEGQMQVDDYPEMAPETELEHVEGELIDEGAAEKLVDEAKLDATYLWRRTAAIRALIMRGMWEEAEEKIRCYIRDLEKLKEKVIRLRKADVKPVQKEEGDTDGNRSGL